MLAFVIFDKIKKSSLHFLDPFFQNITDPKVEMKQITLTEIMHNDDFCFHLLFK